MDWLTFVSKLIWQLVVIGILYFLRSQIMGLLETLKEWSEFKIKDFWVKRRDRASKVGPPEPTGTLAESIGTLPNEAKIVISTLWKHQQQYYTDHSEGRWSFSVGIGNPKYADYLIGVGFGLKKGLVTISEQNGQSLLTDAGINFCLGHPDQLLPDWDFAKWKLP